LIALDANMHDERATTNLILLYLVGDLFVIHMDQSRLYQTWEILCPATASIDGVSYFRGLVIGRGSQFPAGHDGTLDSKYQ
jgi:hypothetical protein